MGHLKVSALVIGVKKIAEGDRALTLLTDKKGIVKAYAKDAARLKNSMVTATELLAYSDMEIFTKNDSSFVDQAMTNMVFLGLRKNFVSFSLAVYFCKLLDELVPEFDCEGEYLRLSLNTIYFLDKNIINRNLLKVIFELRLLSISGYMPELYSCVRCGKKAYLEKFSPQHGGVICKRCSEGFKISPSVLAAMRHICTSELAKMFYFKISEAALCELQKYIKEFLLYNVANVLSAMQYYEEICNS